MNKRYGRVAALSDCTVSVPEGRISALVGPNGAGKTTLLRLLVGLATPTAGEAAVFGGTPRQDPAYLADIGFLAQEIPLARRNFLAALAEAAAMKEDGHARGGLTIVLSSHLLVDIERVCDHLILLAESRVRRTLPALAVTLAGFAVLRDA